MSHFLLMVAQGRGLVCRWIYLSLLLRLSLWKYLCVLFCLSCYKYIYAYCDCNFVTSPLQTLPGAMPYQTLSHTSKVDKITSMFWRDTQSISSSFFSRSSTISILRWVRQHIPTQLTTQAATLGHFSTPRRMSQNHYHHQQRPITQIWKDVILTSVCYPGTSRISQAW